MSAKTLDRDLLRRDVGAFARWLGAPLSPAQAAALKLETHTTVVAAPRGSGKSRAAAVLALWRAATVPATRVLIISAGETAARRLLSEVKALMGPLASSVLVEQADLLGFDNGSEIRSVPSSEASIRGWRAATVVVDEASLVPESIFAALRPTMAGRDDARLLLLSTPAGAQGHLAGQFFAGEDPDNPFVRSFAWTVADAPWISAHFLEAERQALAPSVFAREYEVSFGEAADSFFTTAEIRAATAPYAMTRPEDSAGGQVVAGIDWARVRDETALVAVGVADDHDRNPDGPPLFVPWAETFSRMAWREQLRHVARLARPWQRADSSEMAQHRAWLPGPTRGRTIGTGQPSGYDVDLMVSEVTGIGSMPSEELAHGLPLVRVHPYQTTNASKIEAYSTLRSVVTGGRLVLPPYEPLLRQLGSLVVSDLPGGGLRIAHRVESDRDDLPDALALACWGLVHLVGLDATTGRATDARRDVSWVGNAHAVVVPTDVRPRRGGLLSSRGLLRTS